MPEMPEVEAVRHALHAHIVGQTIETIQIHTPRIIRPMSITAFQKALMGRTVLGVRRRAKYLLIDLSDSLTLVSHLRMEGKYQYHTNPAPRKKHDAVVFQWHSGQTLVYHDVRKFGTMELIASNQLDDVKPLAQLGPDADDSDAVMQALSAKRTRQRSIKALLLDQSVVAGIGNIYADEVLWAAKLHPETPMKQISLEQCQRVAAHAQRIMRAAIADGGSSINTYESLNGQQGRYQDQLKVYGRAGQACLRCGMTLVKIKAAGRGTHYCPLCQESPMR